MAHPIVSFRFADALPLCFCIETRKTIAKLLRLAATPTQYRVTGVETFIVAPSGVVYQKDLGPNTLKTFQGMDRFNPDKTWRRTDDQW